MMNQQHALLNAILDNPEDDTIRFIYADWLEENGKREQSWFLRASMKNVNYDYIVTDFMRDFLKQREIMDIPNWITHCTINRGFLNSISCKEKDFIEHSKELLHPIQEVKLTDRTPGELYYYPGRRIKYYFTVLNPLLADSKLDHDSYQEAVSYLNKKCLEFANNSRPFQQEE